MILYYNMDRQEFILKLLKENGLKQAWLAEKLGMEKAKLNYHLLRSPALDLELHNKIIVILKKSGIDTKTKDVAKEYEVLSDNNTIPLLTTLIHGGESPMYYFNNSSTEKISVPGLTLIEGTYAVRVTGDSMNDAVHNGDILVININAELVNGKMCACRLKSGEQYLKRFLYIDKDKFQLYSDNTKYTPMIINYSDVESLHRVIKLIMEV